MKFAMMILRRSLAPIVGTVLLTSTRIHEPRRIPPLSIASRSRLPVENEVSVWATGDRIPGFAGAWFSNFVLGSRLNLPLSSGEECPIRLDSDAPQLVYNDRSQPPTIQFGRRQGHNTID